MRYRTLAAVLALAVTTALPAAAQDFPQRDVTHIMPWSAGGGTDTIMRRSTHGRILLGLAVGVYQEVRVRVGERRIEPCRLGICWLRHRQGSHRDTSLHVCSDSSGGRGP